MWLLRIGRQGNWKGRSPAEAARDLTPRRDEDVVEDLSVFRVESAAEAEELAVLWVATQRRPSNIDYVLLPDAVVRLSCAVEHRPTTALHPRLGARHHEILGLDAPERIEALAERLLEADVAAVRINEKSLRVRIDALRATDPELVARLREGW